MTWRQKKRQEELRVEEESKTLEDEWQEKQEQEKPEVKKEDIAQVVSMWTGIPVVQIGSEETERLLHMEETLHKRIVGQDEAIDAISKSVRRARAGLKDPRRPIGTFMFLGPTGVGKTELARALAEFMFGNEKSFIRLDMSEFMEKHTVSRLVGAPPGYVGFEEAGQLTEAIRRHPYSIVVFDEIEKAHPEAHNMLLQIMEEGHLSDAKGHKVDFRNTIIVMTTNVGADLIKHQASLGFQMEKSGDEEGTMDYEEMRKKLLDALKKIFRPEFINRVDSVIVFHALNKRHMRQIALLELGKVSERLKEHNLSLEASDTALERFVEEGYNPEMGARPLRRVIQQKVEDALSDKVLSGEFKDGDSILIDVDDESQIILKKKEEPVSEKSKEKVKVK